MRLWFAVTRLGETAAAAVAAAAWAAVLMGILSVPSTELRMRLLLLFGLLLCLRGVASGVRDRRRRRPGDCRCASLRREATGGCISSGLL